jgi:dephospho-CoA kinase
VIKRDQSTELQIRARIDKQFSDTQKLQLAQHLIHNDESESVILQVMELHHSFSTIK